MTAHVSRAVSFYFRFKHRLYTKTTQENALILDCSLLDAEHQKYKKFFFNFMLFVLVSTINTSQHNCKETYFYS